MSQIEDLEKLAELKKKRIITQEEFDEQKKNILKSLNFGSDEGSSAKLSPFGYYKLCWKKYIKFSGRANRSEYWSFWLFNFLVRLILGFCSGFLGFFSPALAMPFNACYWIYSIVVLLPSLAVFTRRYHDIGRSAWFAFVPLYLCLVLAIVAVAGLIIDYVTIDDTMALSTSDVAFSAVTGSFQRARRWIFIFGGFALLIVYILWNIVFPCFASQKGPNKYGPQP